ncbi:TPA: hypothetical protein N0F65_006422 [Lagenidium giganteum]|uniref:DDE-1 domain-containing protein n=1 Tax=Lagenidium giganteum TaxID=4803 RepID=A0AAV2Z0P9_9STRA|nr:TPA: hypothetical protein N0F65_006422 [Lagenidium giganteum]
MVLGDMHGNKYPPFVIVKAPMSKIKKKKAENEKTQNGFWNGNLTIEFLRVHFADRPSLDKKVLLLLDDLPGHWTPKAQEYATSINVLLMKVPPGFTYVCQPADRSWINPFKQRLRSKWYHAQLKIHTKYAKKQACKLAALSPRIREINFTCLPAEAAVRVAKLQKTCVDKPFRPKAPSRTDIGDRAAEAWRSQPTKTIKSGFTRAGLGNVDTRPSSGVCDSSSDCDSSDISDGSEDSTVSIEGGGSIDAGGSGTIDNDGFDDGEDADQSDGSKDGNGSDDIRNEICASLAEFGHATEVVSWEDDCIAAMEDLAL